MRIIDYKLNKNFPVEDKELFERLNGQFISPKEKEFFEEMICKEIYDTPISTFDVIMHENDNEDKIFIQKMYASEYEIGRFNNKGKYTKLTVIPQSLSELLAIDLFPLLKVHISVLDWLRKRDYRGVCYTYLWEE